MRKLVVVGCRGGFWRLLGAEGGDEHSGFVERRVDDTPHLSIELINGKTMLCSTFNDMELLHSVLDDCRMPQSRFGMYFFLASASS